MNKAKNLITALRDAGVKSAILRLNNAERIALRESLEQLMLDEYEEVGSSKEHPILEVYTVVSHGVTIILTNQ